jgi:DNA-binding XRE family transcriptional regulator
LRYKHARSRALVDRYKFYQFGLTVSIEILSMSTRAITIRQVKAARALLGWSQSALAHHSGISEPTIARLESGDGELGGRDATIGKIRRAIEAAGIEFIDQNGGGLGVRLRKADHSVKRRKERG